MLSIGYLIIAVVDLALLVWALKMWKVYPSTALYLATAPLFLLWYDNVVIGLGSTIGERTALKAMNTVRFLLMLFGVYLCWKIGYKWLFLGALGATAVFAVPYTSTGGIFSNMGEPIISIVILTTAIHITKRFGHGAIAFGSEPLAILKE